MKKLRIRGFTLVELMTVLAVMGVLAAVAFPGMRVYMDKQRLVSQVRAISEMAQLARAEAIKHSSSTDPKTVSLTVNPGTPWSVGLSNGTAACSTATNCIINQGGTNVGYRLTATDCTACTMSSPAAQAVVTFDTRGLVMTAGAADELLTLNSPMGKNLSLSVSRLGRISMCTTGNSVGGYPAC